MVFYFFMYIVFSPAGRKNDIDWARNLVVAIVKHPKLLLYYRYLIAELSPVQLGV